MVADVKSIELREAFGNRIRKAREKLGITRKILADILGVGSSTVASWEIGNTMPRKKIVPYIENALEINYLMLLEQASCDVSKNDKNY